MTRQVPSISLQYGLPSDVAAAFDQTNLSIYNELLLATETYLDIYFDIMFGSSGSPAQYYSESSKFHLTTDPFTVDLHVSTDFVLPGDVPTTNFLLDMTRSAFREHYEREYLSMLGSMSHTNPFQKATSVRIVETIPNGYKSSEGKGETGVMEASKKKVVIPLLAAIACLVLLGLGFMCINKGNKKRMHQDDASAKTLVQKGQSSVRKSARGSVKNSSRSGFLTKPYGADDQTIQYLESIRERYSSTDDEESSSSGSRYQDNVSTSKSFDDIEDVGLATNAKKVAESTAQDGNSSSLYIDPFSKYSITKQGTRPLKTQIESALSDEVSKTGNPHSKTDSDDSQTASSTSKDEFVEPDTSSPLQCKNRLADDGTCDVGDEMSIEQSVALIESRESERAAEQQDNGDVETPVAAKTSNADGAVTELEEMESKDESLFDYLVDANSGNTDEDFLF